MKPRTRLTATALQLAVVTLFSLACAAQAQVTLTDIGATAPTPGPNDIAQLNRATSFPPTKPDALNYYWDNSRPPGQTFTTGGNPSGYTLTSVSVQTAGDGSGYDSPNPFALRIYSVSNNVATLIATYNVSAFVLSAQGDWVQWTNLSTFLSPGTTYAYSFGRTGGSGWEAMACTNNNPYAGGEIALIPTGGGTMTFGSSHAWDAAFVIGLTTAAQPPTFTTQPGTNVLYPGGTAVFSAAVNGTPPFTYQWRKNGANLSDGGNIAGSTTNMLTIRNVSAGDAASYDLVVANSAASVTSSVVALTLLSPPGPGTFAESVITNQPLAYWRLGEAYGSATAYDYAGSLNGAYLSASVPSALGPQPPDFIGFESDNTGVGLNAADQSWVTVPALNLNTNAVTIVAWVNPGSGQANWQGILTTRHNGTQAGFNFSGAGNELVYTWNTNTTWQYHSGLIIPTNAWSMVALVVSPTNATFFAGDTSSGLRTASITLNNGVEAWAGSATIGDDDTFGASRAFYGTIDEVAVFKHSLSPAAITALFAAGRAAGMLPPTIVQSPEPQNLYPGRTAEFTVVPSGSPPLSYQWRKDGVNLSDTGNVSGSHTATLTITGVGAADVAFYDVVVSNSRGSATSSTALLQVTAPTGAGYEAAVIAAAPTAYWRLNETGGSVNAFDYYGGFTATYGSYSQMAGQGFPGPESPDFPGFESANTAVQFYTSVAQSWVTAPPLNLNTNTVTITAWIYPSGPQGVNAGLVFQRQGLTVAGLSCGNDGGTLSYNWNDDAGAYNWNSGLTLPQFQWSFVALVVEPAGAVLYLYNTSSQSVAAHALNHPVQPFAGTTYIGNDTLDAAGGRIFNGTIDEVTIWNRALSGEQIAALYTAASGTPLPPAVAGQPATQTVYAGTDAQFTVVAAGTAPLYYQWQKNGVPIAATTTILTIPGVTTSDIAGYTVAITNAYGSITSSVARLNVWDANSAELINVDINDTNNATYSGAAVLGTPSDVWNGIQGRSFNSMALVDSTGFATPVKLTLAKTGGGNWNMAGNALLGDYTYSANPQTITVTGLRTNATYNLVVYSIGGGGNTGFEGGVFSGAVTGIAYGSPLGANQTTRFILGTNYVQNASALSDANGSLTFTILPVSTVAFGNDNGDFNGLQLQHVPAGGIPPMIAQQPASMKRYTGETALFTVAATPQGAAFNYQWYKGGSPIAGGTQAALTLTGVTAGDAGSYSVVVANPSGSVTSQVATLTVLAPVPGTYTAALLTYGPLAYWQLDETNGAVAFDYVGGHDGTYLSAATLGAPGVPNPPFPGFETNNLAVQLVGVDQSWVTVPALNLNTNTVTFTVWIYPNGPQNSWAGIFMTRDGTEAGLSYNDQGMLGYTWNGNTTWDFVSGLLIPSNQWSFVAVAIAPDNAALYLINTNGVQTTNNAIAHRTEAWTGTGMIGDDYSEAGRAFMGVIDEVAVFKRTLSAADILALYTAAPAAPQVTLTIQPVGGNLELTWPQGTLLEANDVTGPWVTNTAASPHTVAPAAAKKFYRVIVR